ncbi:MAG: acetoin utilization protein AcuC [Euryarchaeota archaeon]|nr:acetoin utilization protein AcuC [Euryarchaeota archaeon]MDE1836246.1 acetoin utilization protein AcuC [Euryarchaeota archaeon]MDE1881632.1 acetoin utilization protein AcuC [Euryarchaeota archaeon]MDE2044993.1 acetoin utilization protein AcuC [Thermoplasmata archaeon]
MPLPDRCPLSVIWDPRFLEYDFGPSHPFTEKSRYLSVRLLEESGFFRSPPPLTPGRVEKVQVASDPELLRFHEPSYLELVRNVGRSRHPSALDAGDTPGFPGCHEAAARIARGTLVGLEDVLAHPGSHALNPAGGLHHARPGRASGFCIYDDVALAIATALEGPHPLRRVAYVDIDAHHGDGVMYGFYEDGRVLDIDFHQDGRTLFPGTGFTNETGKGDGKGLKVNVPLPPTAGDDAVLPIFDKIVPPLLRDFKPELVVLQTGVDAHAGDPLAHLQYTPRTYDHAVGTLHELAHELCQGRLLETGGGGYLASSVSRTLARAAGILSGRKVGTNPAEATPIPWQEEFERTTGDEPPRSWGELPPVYRSSWKPEHGEKLLNVLGTELGRKF